MEENFSEDKKKSLIIKLSRLLKKKYKNVQLIDPKYPFEDYIKLQAISIHANKITFLNAYKNIQNPKTPKPQNPKTPKPQNPKTPK